MSQFSKLSLKAWEEEVVNKYPLIFLEQTNNAYAQYNKKTEDFVSLRYGFEHDEGWKGLVTFIGETGTKLVEYLRANGHPDSFIHSCICKEKFGTLRWQGDYNLPAPFDLLWVSFTRGVEQDSASTCELTGKYGFLHRKDQGTWVKTLSPDMAKSLDYIKKEAFVSNN